MAHGQPTTLEQVITELETTKVAERSGRAMDHEAEDAFERLRADGYL
jgi:sulfate adenylyltransferase subunit 2